MVMSQSFIPPVSPQAPINVLAASMPVGDPAAPAGTIVPLTQQSQPPATPIQLTDIIPQAAPQQKQPVLNPQPTIVHQQQIGMDPQSAAIQQQQQQMDAQAALVEQHICASQQPMEQGPQSLPAAVVKTHHFEPQQQFYVQQSAPPLQAVLATQTVMEPQVVPLPEQVEAYKAQPSGNTSKATMVSSQQTQQSIFQQQQLDQQHQTPLLKQQQHNAQVQMQQLGQHQAFMHKQLLDQQQALIQQQEQHAQHQQALLQQQQQQQTAQFHQQSGQHHSGIQNQVELQQPQQILSQQQHQPAHSGSTREQQQHMLMQQHLQQQAILQQQEQQQLQPKQQMEQQQALLQQQLEHQRQQQFLLQQQAERLQQEARMQQQIQEQQQQAAAAMFHLQQMENPEAISILSSGSEQQIQQHLTGLQHTSLPQFLPPHTSLTPHHATEPQQHAPLIHQQTCGGQPQHHAATGTEAIHHKAQILPHNQVAFQNTQVPIQPPAVVPAQVLKQQVPSETFQGQMQVPGQFSAQPAVQVAQATTEAQVPPQAATTHGQSLIMQTQHLPLQTSFPGQVMTQPLIQNQSLLQHGQPSNMGMQVMSQHPAAVTTGLMQPSALVPAATDAHGQAAAVGILNQQYLPQPAYQARPTLPRDTNQQQQEAMQQYQLTAWTTGPIVDPVSYGNSSQQLGQIAQQQQQAVEPNQRHQLSQLVQPMVVPLPSQVQIPAQQSLPPNSAGMPSALATPNLAAHPAANMAAIQCQDKAPPPGGNLVPGLPQSPQHLAKQMLPAHTHTQTSVQTQTHSQTQTHFQLQAHTHTQTQHTEASAVEHAVFPSLQLPLSPSHASFPPPSLPPLSSCHPAAAALELPMSPQAAQVASRELADFIPASPPPVTALQALDSNAPNLPQASLQDHDPSLLGIAEVHKE